MNKQIEKDAVEYGAHIKAGGWRLGLLVARNVEKGKRGGNTGNFQLENARKVVASEFAKAAGTSAARVLRHLDAWGKAAEAGHVPAAATLNPGQDVPLNAEKLPDWGDFYTSVTGGFNGSPDRVPSASSVTKAFAQMEPEQREVVLHELVAGEDFAKALKADPVLRDEVRLKAYEGFDPEESTRKTIQKVPSLGITAVREHIDRAKYEISKGTEMLVKMHINSRVDLEQDDMLGVLRGACSDTGRAIFEFEAALGQPLITERTKELAEMQGPPEWQEDYSH